MVDMSRRESRDFDITITDDLGLVDLTGWKFYLTVSIYPDGRNAVISKTVITPTGLGTVTLELTSTDTDIQPRTYFFDIWVATSGGDKFPIRSDKLTIKPSISNVST